MKYDKKMLAFELLVVAPENIYERRGRVQRVVGIRSELHHHPEALSVPESIFSFFTESFRIANQDFNYYGYTEYRPQDLLRLSNELKANTERFSENDVTDIAEKILAMARDALTKNHSLLVLGI